jgi:hypothetical protein
MLCCVKDCPRISESRECSLNRLDESNKADVKCFYKKFKERFLSEEMR